MKKKKVESLKKSKNVQLDGLLQQATVADYRKALTDLFFEAAMLEDRSIDFPIIAYRIQLLINFFDSLDEKK